MDVRSVVAILNRFAFVFVRNVQNDLCIFIGYMSPPFLTFKRWNTLTPFKVPGQDKSSALVWEQEGAPLRARQNQ